MIEILLIITFFTTLVITLFVLAYIDEKRISEREKKYDLEMERYRREWNDYSESLFRKEQIKKKFVNIMY